LLDTVQPINTAEYTLTGARERGRKNSKIMCAERSGCDILNIESESS